MVLLRNPCRNLDSERSSYSADLKKDEPCRCAVLKEARKSLEPGHFFNVGDDLHKSSRNRVG